MRAVIPKLVLALAACAPVAVVGACRHADAPPNATRAASASATSPSAPASSAPIASGSASVISPDDDPTRGADLDATIEVAIRMLEAKQYRAFLERFIAPRDRPKLLRDGGVDKLLPEFEAEKAERVLALLKGLRGRPPRREGARAIFEGDKRIVWVQEGGRWYIEN